MGTRDELLRPLILELEKKGMKVFQRGMGPPEMGGSDLLALQGGKLLLVGLYPQPEEALICQLLNGYDWARRSLHNLSLLSPEVDPSQTPGVVLIVSQLPPRVKTALSYLPLKDLHIYEYFLSDEGRMLLKEVERETPFCPEAGRWSQEAPLSSEELKELMDLHFGTSQILRTREVRGGTLS